MINLFFGNDSVRVRQKAFSYVEKHVANLDATHITLDNYVPGMMSELTQGASLFGGTSLVILDTLSDDGEVYETIEKLIPDMAASANTFVVIENALTAPQKKKWEKYAEKMEEIKGGAKERFNAFLLTDAYLRKDKKALWLLLMEAFQNGLSNEEIIGVLFWQVKILRLVARTKSAEEAGQKPFVYQKAKRALSVFKEGEIDRHSFDLLSIYHDSHAGKRDAGLALEQWILSM